jgi:hypothetical protein
MYIMLKKILILLSTSIFMIIPAGSLSVQADLPKHEAPPHRDLDSYLSRLHDRLGHTDGKPPLEVFRHAAVGFFTLKAEDEVHNNLLTVIDFSLSSNDDRLWIVDMEKLEVIHQSLVSHGRNSGELYATRFSNIPSSYQSSLGFYLTGDVYFGRHGMSLYLDGMEGGINDKARKRTIVMHGADYVSHDFIRRNERLGRSHGCPAIPKDNHEEIIQLLSGRSCLFIYHTDEAYHDKTAMNVDDKAVAGLIKFIEESHVFAAVLSGLRPFVRTTPVWPPSGEAVSAR